MLWDFILFQFYCSGCKCDGVEGGLFCNSPCRLSLQQNTFLSINLLGMLNILVKCLDLTYYNENLNLDSQ